MQDTVFPCCYKDAIGKNRTLIQGKKMKAKASGSGWKGLPAAPVTTAVASGGCRKKRRVIFDLTFGIWGKSVSWNFCIMTKYSNVDTIRTLASITGPFLECSHLHYNIPWAEWLNHKNLDWAAHAWRHLSGNSQPGLLGEICNPSYLKSWGWRIKSSRPI